ncbi:DUF3987 domain-containing protein [Methanolobus halotolerans]|uniref:DNA primase/polymerase bifunctional N-terminal domain-containing protein n=1 Tax=Methanolobus halotolerans TaxID=2052935 RepID=A0A4E0PUL8_9EURY|nr:DUF3987 domain-containing protein [Methanolobus halotolerans]TGC07018.1 hypothetical protein CUN85_12040 [Methanolobus halotolerans]
MTVPLNDMSLYDASKYYHEIGMRPHPLSKPDDKRASPGKRPLVENWNHIGILTDRQYEKHFMNNKCNIGNVCGKDSNTTVIDRDFIVKGIWEYITEGIETSLFVIQKRINSRDHLFFKYTPKLESKKYHALGFELLNDGCNVVLSPSIHKSGQRYQFNKDPADKPEIPSSMVNRIEEICKDWESLISKLHFCRPAFQRFFQAHFVDNTKSNPHYRDMSVFHGSTGRELELHLFAELKRNGATEKELMILCMLIHLEEYDSQKSSYQIDKINPEATATTDTIKKHPILSQFSIEKDYDCRMPNISNEPESVENSVEDNILPIDIELLKECIGEHNFIIDFIDYVDLATDAYPEYAFQNAVMILSTIVKRRLRLNLAVGPVYPNIWSINIGLSTVSRKSTVFALALDLLESNDFGILLPGDFTPEALVSQMATKTVYEKQTKNGSKKVEKINEKGKENSSKGFWRDEYSSFVAGMTKSYNQSLKEFLCLCYDCPIKYDRALRREHFYLEDVYLPINVNTTIAALSEVVNSRVDFSSGWLPRHLFVNPTYSRESRRMNLMSEEQVHLRNKLCDFLRYMDKALNVGCLDVGIESDALEYWNDWSEFKTQQIQKAQDEVEAAAFGRYNIVALKLAILFELGKQYANTLDSLSEINDISILNSLSISIESIQCAIFLIDNMYMKYFREVKELIELNNLQNYISVTLNVLKKKKEITRSKLLRATKLSSRDLDEALRTLSEREQLEIIIDDKNSKKPVTLYRYIHRCDNDVESEDNLFKNTCGCKNSSFAAPTKKVNCESIETKLTQEQIYRFCKNWECKSNKHINSQNYVVVAEKCCQKHKGNDLQRVLFFVSKYAKIASTAFSIDHVDEVNSS